MFENQVITKETLPEDLWCGDLYDVIKSQIINTLSENKITISQTRYLFNSIIEQFEKNMPVTNHKI